MQSLPFVLLLLLPPPVCSLFTLPLCIGGVVVQYLGRQQRVQASKEDRLWLTPKQLARQQQRQQQVRRMGMPLPASRCLLGSI